MSESLFLINPRRKRRKNPMPAGLRRYWAARRGRKSNPRRRKRRTARVVLANPRRRRHRASNPRRRRHRHRATLTNHRRRRRRNPLFAVRHRRRHRHRNPFTVGGLKQVLMPAAIGAGGAIGLSIAYSFLSPYLPSQLTSGYFPALVQAAGAIGLGMLAGRFLGRQSGTYVTLGGLTVVLVNAITPIVQSSVPGLPALSGLGRVGDYVPYQRGMGAYMQNPGALRRPGMGRLGFVSPAPTVGGGIPVRGGMGAYMTSPVAGMADYSGGSGYSGLYDGM